MTPRIPESLRRYVIDQDYERYSEQDHAVWREVIGSIAERLGRSAHPSYAKGFAAAGMDRDRVPRIEAMDASLGAIGWGAVAVDGFIPPRAFQAFQAARILPIAREVRRPEHLEYTPAPDILHEAAGHAPMLADPEYAEYARRIGELGRHVFRLPSDDEAYEAIRELSIVKEAEGTTADELARVEARVARAMDPSLPVSEAGRLARLHWWTIEYGLVGRVDDFRIYGAGLLSSLGESASCLSTAVRKLPLRASCVETPYDITRPQPQLFVVREFSELAQVLDDVMATTAYRRGGVESLEVAASSDEPAVIRFVEGGSIEGRIASVESLGAERARLRMHGSVTVRDRVGAVADLVAPREGRIRILVDREGAAREEDDGPVPLVDARRGIASCHPVVD